MNQKSSTTTWATTMMLNALNCQRAVTKTGTPARIVAPQANGQASKGPVSATTKTVSYRVTVSQGNVTVKRSNKA